MSIQNQTAAPAVELPFFVRLTIIGGESEKENVHAVMASDKKSAITKAVYIESGNETIEPNSCGYYLQDDCTFGYRASDVQQITENELAVLQKFGI